MNKMLIKREIANLAMLGKIAKSHAPKVFFWSIADGGVRRFHLDKLYEKTHYYRHEACKEYLKKKYSYVIEEYKRKQFDKLDLVRESSPIWRYWHQGIENAPYPVDITLESVIGKCGKHPVSVLNGKTYREYVNLPQYIEKRRKKNQMNIAVFSDFLRLALLKEYGGIWLDSTFYVSNDFPGIIDQMPFYSIKQGNIRKWVVTKDLWSVCLLACGRNNPLVSFVYDFLAEYWKEEITPIAYLMTDCIIAIGYEEIPVIRQLIDAVPDNNLHCFDFLSEFRNEEADYVRLRDMQKDTYVYQLSYKYDWKNETDKGKQTNFKVLISNSI